MYLADKKMVFPILLLTMALSDLGSIGEYARAFPTIALVSDSCQHNSAGEPRSL
jgi:hypothetical protein